MQFWYSAYLTPRELYSRVNVPISLVGEVQPILPHQVLPSVLRSVLLPGGIGIPLELEFSDCMYTWSCLHVACMETLWICDPQGLKLLRPSEPADVVRLSPVTWKTTSIVCWSSASVSLQEQKSEPLLARKERHVVIGLLLFFLVCGGRWCSYFNHHHSVRHCSDGLILPVGLRVVLRQTREWYPSRTYTTRYSLALHYQLHPYLSGKRCPH